MGYSIPTVAILPFPTILEQAVLALIIIIPLLLIFAFLLISEEAFEVIGFRFRQAVLMTVGALVGSFINIPIIPLGDAVIAVNVGGCIIPLFITFELVAKHRTRAVHTLAAIAAVSLITFYFAVPVPGVGITMPFYIAPLAGAAVGLLISRGCGTAPALAYAGGTVGTLLGADIFNLMNPTVLTSLTVIAGTTLSIGGAGIFDGIFVTGIIAVALAAYFGRRIRKMNIACREDDTTESG
jgi:uncharacterized membrane protein